MRCRALVALTGLAVWAPQALLATASQSLPVGGNTYQIVDKLEALGCAFPTFRALGPQTFFDLRSAVDWDSEKTACQAPEWLLDERQLLLRPVWLPEYRADGFVGPDDRLNLPSLPASLWPLFPLRQNRPSVNGVNLSNELPLSFRTGTETWGYALGVTPGFFAGYDTNGKILGRFYVLEGYAKIAYGFSEFTLGRLARRFGEAHHGSLLYSGASAPLDAMEYALRPIVPGGAFSFLGPVSLRTWLGSQGGSDIAVPGTWLWGVEWGLRPFHWWELAFAELIQFGGTGSPDLSVGDYMAFPFSGGTPSQRHLSFAVNSAFWLPHHWAKVYGQVLLNRISDPAIAPVSFLVGAWAPRIGRADVRLEYVRTAQGAYQHPFWTQGLTYRGSPLGHPLGADAEGLYVDVGLPPLFTWWHGEIGLLLEARGLSLAGAQGPEKRYGVSLVGGRRWGYSDIEARLVYHQAHNWQFSPGAISDIFGGGLVYRYSF